MRPPLHRSSRCCLGPRRCRGSVRRRRYRRCCRPRRRRCQSTRSRQAGMHLHWSGRCSQFHQSRRGSSSGPRLLRSSGPLAMRSGRMCPTIRRCHRPCPCCRPDRRHRRPTILRSRTATHHRCRSLRRCRHLGQVRRTGRSSSHPSSCSGCCQPAYRLLAMGRCRTESRSRPCDRRRRRHHPR